MGDESLRVLEDAEILTLVETHLLEKDSPRPVEARCVYARWKPRVAVTACFDLRFSDRVNRLITYKRYVGMKAAHIRDSFEPDEYTAELVTPSVSHRLWR